MSDYSLIEPYGEYIREYHGEGRLALDSHGSYECSFRMLHLQRGDVLIQCNVSEPLPIIKESWNCTLIGTTRDGRPFETRGSTHLFRAKWRFGEANSARVVLRPKEVYVGQVEADLTYPLKLCYGLSNFLFSGFGVVPTETEEENVRDDLARLSLPTLELEGTILTINQLPNYNEIEEVIKCARGARITSEAMCIVQNEEELDRSWSMMAHLCNLLTIAKGTEISWLYLDFLSSSGDLLASPHYSTFAHPHERSPMMLPDGIAIHRFVQSTYRHFVELNTRFGIDIGKVARIYAAIRRPAHYVVNGLLLGSLVDYLAGTYARVTNHAYIVDENTFEQHRSGIEAITRIVLKVTLKDLRLSGDDLSGMASKVRGFYRRSFRHRLKRFARDCCGVQLSKEDIERFVRERNQLIHEAQFMSGSSTDRDAFMWMLSILDRLLLGILHYEGQYWSVRERTVRTFKRVER